jgi:hypothetical protein
MSAYDPKRTRRTSGQLTLAQKHPPLGTAANPLNFWVCFSACKKIIDPTSGCAIIDRWRLGGANHMDARGVFSVSALALNLVVACEVQASAATLYSQPWTPGNVANSTNEPGPNNTVTTYDNFTLASSATIRQIDFTGDLIAPAAIVGFTVQIYADGPGGPQGSLYSVHINTEDAGQTFLPSPVMAHLFTYSLPVNFSANGGTQYWLSIVGDTVTTGIPLLWVSGIGPDSFAVLQADNFGNPVRENLDFDLAFTLSDQSVDTTPLPAALPLFATGLGALGLLGWRRRRKTTGVAA